MDRQTGYASLGKCRKSGVETNKRFKAAKEEDCSDPHLNLCRRDFERFVTAWIGAAMEENVEMNLRYHDRLPIKRFACANVHGSGNARIDLILSGNGLIDVEEIKCPRYSMDSLAISHLFGCNIKL